MSKPLDPSQCPAGVLQSEHRVIERVLRVLQAIVRRAGSSKELEREALATCILFLRQFADAFHHAKEEDLLFPALEKRGIPKEGGPIGVMLYEHKLGREMIRRIDEALEAQAAGDQTARDRGLAAIREYIELLTGHIYKEDNILFPMGDRVITEEDRHALCRGFQEVAARKFQGQSPEEYEKLAETLEEKWGKSL